MEDRYVGCLCCISLYFGDSVTHHLFLIAMALSFPALTVQDPPATRVCQCYPSQVLCDDQEELLSETIESLQLQSLVSVIQLCLPDIQQEKLEAHRRHCYVNSTEPGLIRVPITTKSSFADSSFCVAE